MTIDVGFIAHMLVCVALALLGLLVPSIRGHRGLLCAGLVATLLTFRERSLGYLVAVAFVYACVVAISALANGSRNPAALRWRFAVAVIFLLVAGFSALRIAGSESVLLDVSGRQLVILALDMWLVLRLVTVVWETGAGRIKEQRALDFAAWALKPFTVFGPVLRYSDYQRQAQSWPEPGKESTKTPKMRSRTFLLGLIQMAAGYGMAYVQFLLPTHTGSTTVGPGPDILLAGSVVLLPCHRRLLQGHGSLRAAMGNHASTEFRHGFRTEEPRRFLGSLEHDCNRSLPRLRLLRPVGARPAERLSQHDDRIRAGRTLAQRERILGSLGHPSRRRILYIPSVQEICCTAAASRKLDASWVSQRAGLGCNVFLRLFVLGAAATVDQAGDGLS